MPIADSDSSSPNGQKSFSTPEMSKDETTVPDVEQGFPLRGNPSGWWKIRYIVVIISMLPDFSCGLCEGIIAENRSQNCLVFVYSLSSVLESTVKRCYPPTLALLRRREEYVSFSGLVASGRGGEAEPQAELYLN
jgi:hypothetical protein